VVSWRSFLWAVMAAPRRRKARKWVTCVRSAGQAPISGEPGHRSFDDPPVPAEFRVAFDAFAGDADLDALVTHPRSEVGLVVGLVGMQLGGLAPAWATSGLDRRDRHHQRLEREGVVGVGRGDRDRQRQACPVGQDVDLRAELAAVDGAGAGQRSPFFARIAAPSTITRDQSTNP
jgi:hypothetical protein